MPKKEPPGFSDQVTIAAPAEQLARRLPGLIEKAFGRSFERFRPSIAVVVHPVEVALRARAASATARARSAGPTRSGAGSTT